MICQTCHGERLVTDKERPGAPPLPCPDCLGGEQHCCEGEQCQPEPTDALMAEPHKTSHT